MSEQENQQVQQDQSPKKKKGGTGKGVGIGCGLGCLGLLLVIALFGGCVMMMSPDSIEDLDEPEEEVVTEEGTDDLSEESEEEINPEEVQYGVNETMNYDGELITVTSVEKRAPAEYDAVQNGYEYVVVALQIDNESDEEISYNPLNFELQDGNGNITSSFGGGSLDDVTETLSSGSLAPGGTTSGNIIFEVPEGDEDLTLRYEASFWSDTIIEFRLYE